VQGGACAGIHPTWQNQQKGVITVKYLSIGLVSVLSVPLMAAAATLLESRTADKALAFNSDKPAVVYILSGQSNMAGQSPITDDIRQELATVNNVKILCVQPWFFEDNSGKLRPGQNLTWQKLTTCGAASNWFGPEVTFGLTVARSMPDKEIYLIKYAHGGTSLFCEWQPTPPAPVYHAGGGDEACVNYLKSFSWKGPGNMWTWERFDTTLELARSILPRHEQVTYGGMLWLQGEADAEGQSAYPFLSQHYEKNLEYFIQTVRKRTAQPQLPFVISKIKCGWDNAPWGNPLKMVRDAQQRLTSTMTNVYAFDTWDLPLQEEINDCCHFASSSMKTIGERYAYALGLKSDAPRYPAPAAANCKSKYGPNPP
jgi:hypothetical protein